jgi:hypothetical protein
MIQKFNYLLKENIWFDWKLNLNVENNNLTSFFWFFLFNYIKEFSYCYFNFHYFISGINYWNYWVFIRLI